jgi:BirA family biotin operon repressor/biotin-[acetyl-CoA-carboxylase] ligase
MDANADLSPDAVAAALGERPVQVYPAVLSTEATAQAWARQGAPAGAVVTAVHQASPRGRAGRPLDVDPDRDLTFSMVVRPPLTPEREGWIYTAATAAVAEVLGQRRRAAVTVQWPDTVSGDDAVIANVGVHAELGPARLDWAVVTVHVAGCAPPRGEPLRDLVEGIETSLERDPDDVLVEQRGRCTTLGDGVRALMIPMGPAGPRVQGTGADLRDDGSLVIATPAGGRIAVRPQHLGMLERTADDPPTEDA